MAILTTPRYGNATSIPYILVLKLSMLNGGDCRVIDFEAGNHTIVGFWATMTSQMGFGEVRPVFR